MNPQLLSYYEAIERASADMLTAARAGRWDDVVKLEGACVLLISQLKNASLQQEEAHYPVVVEDEPARLATSLPGNLPGRLPDKPMLSSNGTQYTAAGQMKSRIMQRILVNDAEIRQLAEPWLQELDDTLAGRRPLMH